jgi:hypothetical protein
VELGRYRIWLCNRFDLWDGISGLGLVGKVCILCMLFDTGLGRDRFGLVGSMVCSWESLDCVIINELTWVSFLYCPAQYFEYQASLI